VLHTAGQCHSIPSTDMISHALLLMLLRVSSASPSSAGINNVLVQSFLWMAWGLQHPGLIEHQQFSVPELLLSLALQPPQPNC
jgi:hypothetical protein